MTLVLGITRESLFPDLLWIWLVLAVTAGIIARMRGGRFVPWSVGALIFPPLLVWAMVMPMPQRAEGERKSVS